MWEHFQHQADVGVRGIGKTLDEAFVEGAIALMAVVCSPQKVRPLERVDIRCRADDDELLFADWLNEIIREMETRRMLFSRFEAHVEGHGLAGTAWGERADPERHETAVLPKAATYFMLKVAQNADGNWVVQTVVDV